MYNPEVHIQQDEIKNWFDKTYTTRGSLYLRPVEAYRIFLKILGVRRGEKLLDVACGLGRMLEVCRDAKIKASGIDISEVAIRKCKEILPDLDLSLGNAESLPYSDANFDYITCLGSLERMIDRDKALSEMRRVLKKNGKICLLVRNSNSWKWKFIKKPFRLINNTGHQDALSLQEWNQLISKNGFEIIETYCDQWPIMKFKRIVTIGFWNKYTTIQKCILPLKYANEYIFICQKRD